MKGLAPLNGDHSMGGDLERGILIVRFGWEGRYQYLSCTGAIMVINFGLILQRLAYNNTIKSKEAQPGREATHQIQVLHGGGTSMRLTFNVGS